MSEKRINRLWLPVLLFVLAAILIGLSAVGGVRAALTMESENYVGTFEVQNIGIAITENGEVKEGKDAILQNLAPYGAKFNFNKTYPVSLSTVNTGAIDEYVRVEVYRYWEDADGKKRTDLDPKLIDLTVGGGWIVAPSYGSSDEKMTLYYPTPVAAGGGTAPFVTAVSIDKAVLDNIKRTETKVEKGTLVTYHYTYDGLRFVVEAEADAVQTHNAVEAIEAAWGVRVIMTDDGVISSVH